MAYPDISYYEKKEPNVMAYPDISHYESKIPQEMNQEDGGILSNIGNYLYEGAGKLSDTHDFMRNTLLQSFVKPIVNLPSQAAGVLGDAIQYQTNIERKKLGDYEPAPEIDISSRIPTYEGASELTGIGAAREPENAAERMFSNMSDTASVFAPFGLIGKGKGAAKALQSTLTGTAVGAGSGSMQEVGVNPLAADLLSAFAAPTAARGLSKAAKGTGNLLHKFTSAGQEASAKSAASDILKDKIGDKNIQKVIENLNAKTPFNTQLTTAELGENTGLSSLDRALSSNIPAMAEKQAITDEIIRKQLNMLSPKSGLDPSVQGEAVRDYLSKELGGRKKIRSDVTEPLYKELNEIRQGVDIPNTKAFLEREKKFAKGDIKKNLNYVEDIIQSNTTSKRDAAQFDKLYGNLGQKARSQLEKEVSGQPVPAELTNALKDISGRIGVAKRSGNNEVARVLSKAKENILMDMSQIPEEKIARDAYSRLSKPVSAIEQQPLPGGIVKKDTFGQEFLTSPERIPGKILSSSVKDTKALMSAIGKDKNTLNMVRGSVVDKLFSTSELSSINALGQQNLSYNKLNNFLKKQKGKLEHIFDKNQVKVLDDVKGILKRRNMVATVGRGVGSNTQSQTTLLEGITNPVTQSVGKKFLQKIPGGKYITPVFEFAKDYQKQQITKILEQALLDPKVANKLLTPVSSIKNEQSLKALLQEIGIPATAYTLTKQGEEK